MSDKNPSDNQIEHPGFKSQKARDALGRVVNTLREAKVLRPITDSVGVDKEFLREAEFPAFMKGKPENYRVYGMTAEETKSAEIKWDETRKCLIDSSNKTANIEEKIYNVTIDGKLIVQPFIETEKPFHHSSFTKDGALLCAGDVTIKDGKITNINNNSGHYRPELLDLYNAISALKKQSSDIFHKDATLEGSIGLPNNITTINQFMDHMNPEIVSKLRKEREARDKAISKPTVTKYDGNNFALAFVTHPTASVGDNEIAAHQFSKDAFSKEFQEEYCKKHGVVIGSDGNIPIKNITLTSKELFDVLSSNLDNKYSLAAMQKLLSSNTLDVSIDLSNEVKDHRVRDLIIDEALKNPLKTQNLEILHHEASQLNNASSSDRVVGNKISNILFSNESIDNTIATFSPTALANLYHNSNEETKNRFFTTMRPERDYYTLLEVC